jgi:tRNA nucleotidyltransferase/poly(A) polymerase
MSDYLFMLESHLSADQARVVEEVRTAASLAGVNVFLTGGALRDMLAGFPIFEIDFTVEGDGLQLARAVAAQTGAELTAVDEVRKSAQFLFGGGRVCGSIGMARTEVSGQVKPATIHEDLRGRDFTINSIALSLNAASKGLLLDPTNGVGDIERKELRTVTNYAIYDDPIRMLRLHRFKVRLGFSVVDRTRAQFTNAMEGGLQDSLGPEALGDELGKIAAEQNIADLIRVLEEEKLLRLYSPALTGPKLNLPGLQKLQKAKQMLPFGAGLKTDHLSLLLNVLLEKLAPAEVDALAKAAGLAAGPLGGALKQLDERIQKIEKDLKGAELQKPSKLYAILSKAQGEEIALLLVRSAERLVQDRIRHYLQKYLPAAQEVTDEEVAAAGGVAGTPAFEKVRAELIATRLDTRPKKVVPVEEEPPAPPPPPTHAFARRGG